MIGPSAKRSGLFACSLPGIPDDAAADYARPTASVTARGRPGCRGQKVSSSLAMLKANDQPQAGPCLVDGADLIVDKAHRKSDVADYMVRHIRRDPRRLLWPSNPESRGRSHALPDPSKLPFQLLAASHEDDNDVERVFASQPNLYTRPWRQLAQSSLEVRRGADEGDPVSILDAKLLWQWRT